MFWGAGTNPQAGVDLEPDFPSHQLSNVTFRDNVFTGNSGAGFRSCLNALNGSTQPVSVLFSGGIVHNNTVMQNTLHEQAGTTNVSEMSPKPGAN